MKDQALRVKLEFSFCLSYRAAYAPTAALLASEMVTSFLDVGLKPYASCQDTSREEQLRFPVEDWPSYVRQDTKKVHLFFCLVSQHRSQPDFVHLQQETTTLEAKRDNMVLPR